MNSMPKLLIGLGILFIVIGLLWQVGGKFFSLGKLPGDILIKRENMTFYFPLATSIVISIVLSVILFVISRFMR
ncbi:DUF2905 domain-containing protein [Aliibacillus thermotolerans]|uniref:DUF2905 domain-containing protein n=1 Tax=Aliibacillus thermotolerans TaxID=1834418 RepID=A0ABW0UD12_9BACI|nr:DUF2905 domain-containing protein [Aliibacillus thermotolerans]MDA3130825.1 DUF2905 family protein [Aliibacillus thermotolerans]